MAASCFVVAGLETHLTSVGSGKPTKGKRLYETNCSIEFPYELAVLNQDDRGTIVTDMSKRFELHIRASPCLDLGL
jgi:hypothetical protein